MELVADRVDRRSAVPLYQQIYAMLRQRIIGGELQPGDMLPPEAELTQSYQVSRATIRQVMDMLVTEGLIYRQAGRGTFVAHPSLEQGTTRIISFTEDMRRRGYEPGTRLLSSGLIPAPPDLASALHIEEGEELARLERLRLADGEPMSIEESHLVHRYCPGVLAKDYSTEPLREALLRDHSIRLVRAKEVIRAVNAGRRAAQVLGVANGSALLLIERVTFSHQDLPIEFLRIWYRGDRYRLYAELHD